jgi:NAD(P)-dependent dehydrogenase (short-subunit alcohol dehydrogenase family)
MKALAGKVAVVTGAASGIGRALADRFAAEGMKVVLADVDEAALRTAVADLEATGASAIGVRTDVRYEEQLQNLATRTMSAFGGVHILCNNAGVDSGGRISDIPASAWEWVLDVNLMGVIHGCHVFLPLLRQQDEAHIVNTGSGASFSAMLPTAAPYITSKFAVLGYSESLELELRSHGEPIGVSLVAPGPTKTRMPEAERNIPDDVSRADVDTERTQVIDLIKSVTAQIGQDPARVAELVLDAILENRFFVLTHPDDPIAAVKTRLEWMAGGPAPVPLRLDERFTATPPAA